MVYSRDSAFLYRVVDPLTALPLPARDLPVEGKRGELRWRLKSKERVGASDLCPFRELRRNKPVNGRIKC